MTSETVRLINSEITSQVSNKINEFNVDLNLHIRETIEQVILDQVLPTFRETSGEIGNGARQNVDLSLVSDTGALRCIAVRKLGKIYRNRRNQLVI